MKYRRLIADLHIHSKYSRACSKLLEPANLATWADKKGIGLLGTGDFLHGKWLEDLHALHEVREGVYGIGSSKCEFIYTTEIASIYKQGEKVRRIHNLIFAPSRTAAENLRQRLKDRGCNLDSDGRPITGVKSEELVKICKDVDERIEIIPAHAWTPHFGVFGSLSGFDTLEQAFGEMTKYIFAIETGLSSDPEMNRLIAAHDNLTLISNSDPHSLSRLGREANVFELPKNFTYDSIIELLKSRDPNRFLYTIEYFPEEGRYHYDGHADCKVSMHPLQAKKIEGICPKCGKKLLRGVLARIVDLSDRTSPEIPSNLIPYRNMIPLEEIIAEVKGVGVASKKVKAEYDRTIAIDNEFAILLDYPAEELTKIGGEIFALAVQRVRNKEVKIKPGYDGEYGKIQIFSQEERESLSLKPKQQSLF